MPKWPLVAAIGVVIGALLALRQPTTAPPEPAPVAARFADVTDQAGIDFRHVSGVTGRKLLPETTGAGVAVLDFDRDGRPEG